MPLFAAGDDLTQVISIVVMIAILVAAMIFLAVFARYFRFWIQSVSTGAAIGIFDLLGMTFRKVNPAVIV
ncbi:MAG: flotillin-like protein FloA, partial [Candidatus Saccharimonadales bacterium]